MRKRNTLDRLPAFALQYEFEKSGRHMDRLYDWEIHELSEMRRQDRCFYSCLDFGEKKFGKKKAHSAISKWLCYNTGKFPYEKMQKFREDNIGEIFKWKNTLDGVIFLREPTFEDWKNVMGVILQNIMLHRISHLHYKFLTSQRTSEITTYVFKEEIHADSFQKFKNKLLDFDSGA